MRIARFAGRSLVAWSALAVPALAQEKPAEAAAPAGEKKESCCAAEEAKPADGACCKEDTAKEVEDAFSATLTVTATSAYYFRGLLNERHGVILQPDLSLGVDLMHCDCDCPLESLALSLDTWNSLHSSKTGSGGGSGTSSPKAWYESDFTAGLVAGLKHGFTLTTSWVEYTSPNNSFTTTSELDFKLGYDDAALWGETPACGFTGLQPSVTLAFEIDGQSDQNANQAGTSEGRFLDIGVAPSWSLCELLGRECATPVTLTLPADMGFSLGSYYEDAAGKDEKYGFADVGAVLSMPLSAIPARYGDWTFSIGVTALFLHGNVARINQGDHFTLVGSAGVSIDF